MEIVNIHQAKTHLARLIARAAAGEPLVIPKAGRPLVKVVPFESGPEKPARLIGYMAGEINVPDDFDTMFQKEI